MGTLSHRNLFFEHVALTSNFPLALEIERAEGCYLFDNQGKEYLDFISGIAVSNVGHRHPKVIKAIKEQCDRYLHLMVYGELIQSPQTLLAEAIVGTLPAGIDNVFFVNSGSEAVEGAIKLAKRYTGRAGIVAFAGAYHGSTQGALSLAGDEKLKNSFRPLVPGITHLRHGKIEDLQLISEQHAAVIIEYVQGEAGVRQAGTKYYEALRKRCTETGTLLIADEIQSGYGRTGKFWSFEHSHTAPDVVVMAKGMGGGMPLGAFAAPSAIMQSLRTNPVLGHITTFGGHPVSCAASLACLQVIQEEELTSKVPEKSKLIQKHLETMPFNEIRAAGLMMAAELGSFEKVMTLMHKALEKGLFTDWFLFCDTAIRIAPPLTITEEEIEKGMKILKECF